MWRLASVGARSKSASACIPCRPLPRTGPRLASGYIDREHNAERERRSGRTRAEPPYCAAFECVCACRLSRAERSDLQLAAGGSGHGAEFIRGARRAFEKGGGGAVASLFLRARQLVTRVGRRARTSACANLVRTELAEGPTFLIPGCPACPPTGRCSRLRSPVRRLAGRCLPVRRSGR